jgi:hypothetical protein
MCYLMVSVVAVGEEAAMPEIPRPEHPRPDLERSDWINLNGPWRFAFDAENRGIDEAWFSAPGRLDREIVVPFPWESRLSGVEQTDYRGVAWYHRVFSIPETWEGRRVFLVFGAVDYSADVWLDGRHLGGHEGGYTPFEIEITDSVRHGAEHDLVVRAVDHTDPETPTGKQIRWYTPTSGIWQTVYLEARGEAYVSALVTEADIGSGSVVLRADIHSAVVATATLSVESLDALFEPRKTKVELNAGTMEQEIVLEVPNHRLWSPEEPALYPFRLEVAVPDQPPEVVESYFAFREIGLGQYGNDPTPRILLNGKPVYLRGALHQSFHPEGLYTYPSEEVLRRDLEKTKEFGLNCLRVHIKVEEPLFYAWADRLGVLILYDLPNFWSHSEAARERWEKMLREAIGRDRGHPCILAWILFNETWGLDDGDEGYSRKRQKWVEQMVNLARELDPTRPVEDNSPHRRDHVETDLNSWHFYIDDYEKAKNHIAGAVERVGPGSDWNFAEGKTQGNQPFFNSEYGAVGAGGGDRDISWGMKYLTNELRKYPKICGYVYTELTDIEWEHNGLMNYDRSEKEFGYDEFVKGSRVADVHSSDFLVLDASPYAMYMPGDVVVVPVLFSSFSEPEERVLAWSWKLWGDDRFGRRKPLDGGAGSFQVQPDGVTEVGEIRVTIPDERMLLTLEASATGRNGRRVAANYVHLDVKADVARVEVVDATTCVLRFQPDDVARSSGHSSVPGKVFATGSCFFEYELSFPEGLNLDAVDSIELLAELAAKAGDEKLDWPERTNEMDYAQTDTKKHPSEVIILIQGVEVDRFVLPDDPADARGVLSHAATSHHGSYGYIHRLRILREDFSDLWRAIQEAGMLRIRYEVPKDADPMGGLAIFGDTMGRWPVQPTVILRGREPLGLSGDQAGEGGQD